MIVGLTGGVASGKSLVTAELKRLGAHVVDADVAAREAVRPGSPALAEIRRTFGEDVIRPDGTLDRKALAAIVFSDPGNLKKLNKITHPPIRKIIEAEISDIRRSHPDALIIVDAALLIETGLYRKMDKVVVVYADEDAQISRLKIRDSLTEAEASRRIGAQMPLSEKTSFADYVIMNTGTEEETLSRARSVYEELKKACP